MSIIQKPYFRISRGGATGDGQALVVLTAPSHEIESGDPDPTAPFRQIDPQGSIAFNVLDESMYFSNGDTWELLTVAAGCVHINLNGDTGTSTSASCILNCTTKTSSASVYSTMGGGSTLSIGLKNGILSNDRILWNSTSSSWVISNFNPSSVIIPVSNITSTPATLLPQTYVSTPDSGTYTLPTLASSNALVDLYFATSVNPKGANGAVNSLVTDGTYVYAGGAFTEIDGISIPYLARYAISTGKVDTTWNLFVDGNVNAMALDGSGNLYIGGDFANVLSTARGKVAKIVISSATLAAWNPTALNGSVKAIAIDGAGNIYIGGAFTYGGINYIEKTNNTTGALDGTFTPGLLVGTVVSSITIDTVGSLVYLGGTFSSINATTRNNIAVVNYSGALQAWNPNADNSVTALLLNGTNLYTGGSFANIGGQARNSIARLSTTTGNADSWNPNIVGAVLGFSLIGSNLYTAGSFSSVGSIATGGIARINTTSALADSNYILNPSAVNCLCNVNNNLYIGGPFTTLKNQIQNNIAQLLTGVTVTTPDGATIQPFGTTSINLFQDSFLYRFIGYTTTSWLLECIGTPP